MKRSWTTAVAGATVARTAAAVAAFTMTALTVATSTLTAIDVNSGKFTVALSSIDLGQGMKSVTRQICAETLGVPVEDVYVDVETSKRYESVPGEPLRVTLLTVSVGLPPTVPLAAGATCTGVPSTT